MLELRNKEQNTILLHCSMNPVKRFNKMIYNRVLEIKLSTVNQDLQNRSKFILQTLNRGGLGVVPVWLLE